MGVLLQGLFASIAGFFAQWVTKKTAFGLAAVGVFGALTVALLALIAAAITAALAGIGLPTWVAWGFWFFMPSGLPAAAAAVISAQVSVGVYRWNMENLRLLAYVT